MSNNESPSGKLGILVGGGPAPGINGVISAATIGARRNNLDVIGIYDGYKWLTKGDFEKLQKNIIPLRIADVSRIHYDGGSILRTSRTNPIKVQNGIKNSVEMLKKLGITYMVTIGGDDTSYGAMQIAEAAKGEIKFAHVPKTIDNDLPLPDNIPTFGFETARHYGSGLVKNLMEDSRVMSRWGIVVSMGRHAGHLGLGIAKASGATLAIIAEEFGLTGKIALKNICDIFEASIIKRRAMGNDHGVLVISEGISERFDEEELKFLPGVSLSYDNYGHLQLSEIELGKIVKQEIERRFKERGDKTKLIELNLGYVLRCADPIPFDLEYTRDLGFSAIKYLLSDLPEYKGNAMICVDSGKLMPMKFEDIIDPKTGKTEIRYVDVTTDSYRIARQYMIRLEARDLQDEFFLQKLAMAAKMTPEQFKDRFKHVAV